MTCDLFGIILKSVINVVHVRRYFGKQDPPNRDGIQVRRQGVLEYRIQVRRQVPGWPLQLHLDRSVFMEWAGLALYLIPPSSNGVGLGASVEDAIFLLV